MQRHLIEIYKALHNNSETILKELFIRRKSTINLRSKSDLVMPSTNSILKGRNFLRYFNSVIWNLLPVEIREDHLILSFVAKINNKNQLSADVLFAKFV